jgi:hypothetical protein
MPAVIEAVNELESSTIPLLAEEGNVAVYTKHHPLAERESATASSRLAIRAPSRSHQSARANSPSSATSIFRDDVRYDRLSGMPERAP